MTPDGITDWEVDDGEDTESASQARFQDLYSELVPKLIGYVHSRFPGLGHFGAEDVVADVMITAYNHWDRLEHLENPTAYLFKSAAHRAIDMHRRLHRSRTTEDGAIATLTPGVVPAHMDRAVDDSDDEAAEVLRDEIRRMRPSRKREVVLLQASGLSDSDIAEALGITTNQVYVQRHHAVSELRKRLRQHIRNRPARTLSTPDAPPLEQQQARMDSSTSTRDS
ncbi:RNA polymerase sigma factor [Streptomyces sp. NPDC055103]